MSHYRVLLANDLPQTPLDITTSQASIRKCNTKIIGQFVMQILQYW
jgi:uncharacterized protein with von Willebrand factor type A (vWA) domain